jgi:hypothetical protein
MPLWLLFGNFYLAVKVSLVDSPNCRVSQASSSLPRMSKPSRHRSQRGPQNPLTTGPTCQRLDAYKQPSKLIKKNTSSPFFVFETPSSPHKFPSRPLALVPCCQRLCHCGLGGSHTLLNKANRTLTAKPQINNTVATASSLAEESRSTQE